MSEQTSWMIASPDSDGGSLPPYVIEAGGLLRQTRDLLTSDLLHSDGTLAFVYGDATSNFNGIYIKSGDPGEGSWIFTLSLAYLLLVGAGGSPTGLSDIHVDATSDPADQAVAIGEAGGVKFVDGAAGSFNVPFDPSILPGMGVWVKRKDSVTNANPVRVTGESGLLKGTLTTDGDRAYFKSSNSGTTVEYIDGNIG